MPITVDDLKTNAKMQTVLCLDMAHGAYSNMYQSLTYPRFNVVKEGDQHSPKVPQHHTTSYYVDGIPCKDLDEVVRMLNTEPHPMRENVARHQAESGEP